LQLAHGSADLLRPLRLRLHALMDGVKLGRERLYLGDNLCQVGSYRADLLCTLVDIVGKVIYPHHARRDGRGHLLHNVLDIQSGLSSLVCQTPDFPRYHGKSQAMFAGFLGLDGGIQRQQGWSVPPLSKSY
jgi:hypothetical protein